VHHYAADDYPVWTRDLGANIRFAPGGFGENVSTRGITEDDICIGDILAIGAARVQVSQGRQPCWKLSDHTGTPRMAYHVQRTARTGWYYRVLDPGVVAPGDAVRLLDRPQPDWSILRVSRARFDRTLDANLVRHLAALPELNEGWRAAVARRSEGGAEDASKRLDG
jgi:MOSC domain-containing protein YiiM